MNTNFGAENQKKNGSAVFELLNLDTRPKFDDFEVKYLQIENFSEKQVSFKLKVIFSTNFRSKTKKIVRAVFEKNMKDVLFWANLEISKSRIFFKNPVLSLF